MNAPGESPRSFGSWSASPRFVLRLFLIAIATSTTIGIWFAVTNRDAFQAAFSGAADPRIYAGLLGVGVLGLISLVGLWRWRRWGLFLYGVVASASLGMDIAARAPGIHQLTVIIAAAIMALLVHLNRAHFQVPGKTTNRAAE